MFRFFCSGQAFVETAIAGALLSFLLIAAVDGGIAYKRYQTLVNATAETSSYLAHNPYVSPAVGDSPTKAEADKRAITAFHNEQASSRAEGTKTAPDPTILEAASSDVKVSGGTFGVLDTFNTSNSKCTERRNVDIDGNPCYIVVRSETVYNPIFLAPVFGKQVTIKTVSIKPIVGYPR